MKSFDVLVRYRTRSGCNAAVHTVRANYGLEAARIAANERRRKRGVIRIDSCETREALVWAAPGKCHCGAPTRPGSAFCSDECQSDYVTL